MGNAVGQRYDMESSFVDQASGFVLRATILSNDRICGRCTSMAPRASIAVRIRRDLRRRDFEEGNGVPLFFLGFNAEGEAVAGSAIPRSPRGEPPGRNGRRDGRLAPTLTTSPRSIERRGSFGASRCKGAWSKGEAVVGQRLAVAMARCFVHAMNWLGAELAVAAISDRLLEVGALTGGVQVGTSWVPFPDDRYRTVAVAFRRTLSYEMSTESNQQALRVEGEQLSRGPSKVGAGVEPDDSVAMRSRRRGGARRHRAQSARGAAGLARRLHHCRYSIASTSRLPNSARFIRRRLVRYSTKASAGCTTPGGVSLVRLLGPRAFSTLRLDRNHNKLTRDEQVAASHVKRRRRGLERGPLDRARVGHGRSCRRATRRRLRYPRGHQPQPRPGGGHGPRGEQSGRSRLGVSPRSIRTCR